MSPLSSVVLSALTLLLLLHSAAWPMVGAQTPKYFFSYHQTCTLQGSTYVFALTLTTTFVTGTSTTTANAEYLITGVTGTVTVNGGAAQSVTYDGPNYYQGNDNELFPYGQITDVDGFDVDFAGTTANLYADNSLILRSVHAYGPCSGATVTLIMSAVSDPYFVGFWGQRFTIAGVAGAVYSLLSDRLVSISAAFVWLASDSISCPLQSNGVVMDGCTNTTGTYFGSLSVRSAGG